MLVSSQLCAFACIGEPAFTTIINIQAQPIQNYLRMTQCGSTACNNQADCGECEKCEPHCTCRCVAGTCMTYSRCYHCNCCEAHCGCSTPSYSAHSEYQRIIQVTVSTVVPKHAARSPRCNDQGTLVITEGLQLELVNSTSTLRIESSQIPFFNAVSSKQRGGYGILSWTEVQYARTIPTLVLAGGRLVFDNPVPLAGEDAFEALTVLCKRQGFIDLTEQVLRAGLRSEGDQSLLWVGREPQLPSGVVLAEISSKLHKRCHTNNSSIVNQTRLWYLGEYAVVSVNDIYSDLYPLASVYVNESVAGEVIAYKVEPMRLVDTRSAFLSKPGLVEPGFVELSRGQETEIDKGSSYSVSLAAKRVRKATALLSIISKARTVPLATLADKADVEKNLLLRLLDSADQEIRVSSTSACYLTSHERKAEGLVLGNVPFVELVTSGIFTLSGNSVVNSKGQELHFEKNGDVWHVTHGATDRIPEGQDMVGQLRLQELLLAQRGGHGSLRTRHCPNFTGRQNCEENR